ncbi:hypothetical protein P4O66_006952 [Electrophorus voltai]|uniref:Chromo domain-containing protein n=1 Tax=Electrophorus voltai TaxID=2609070 RepID=A0AAD8ZGM4_9TELE|nr:hypothetical protein P4O66_006952 [Electrophorus voltai]
MCYSCSKALHQQETVTNSDLSARTAGLAIGQGPAFAWLYLQARSSLHLGHSYRLALPPSLRVHPAFHVSRLKPVLCSVAPPTHQECAWWTCALAYMVKRLLDIRRVCGGVQYLVDWEGYGPEEQSWVSSPHILDCELIRAFQRDHAAGLGMSGAAPSGGSPVIVDTRPRPPPSTGGALIWWFTVGLVLLAVCVSLAAFCIVYLEWFRGIKQYDQEYPAIPPITTAAFIAASCRQVFNIALWPVWSFLTPVILFTQFMGVVMVISLLG